MLTIKRFLLDISFSLIKLGTQLCPFVLFLLLNRKTFWFSWAYTLSVLHWGSGTQEDSHITVTSFFASLNLYVSFSRENEGASRLGGVNPDIWRVTHRYGISTECFHRTQLKMILIIKEWGIKFLSKMLSKLAEKSYYESSFHAIYLYIYMYVYILYLYYIYYIYIYYIYYKYI